MPIHNHRPISFKIMFIKNNTLKKIMPYAFWGLLAMTTFLLLIEVRPSKAIIPHLDKIIHATLFLLLSTLGYLSFSKQSTFIFLGLAFYAALTEGLQKWLTASRHASFADWVADITGIVLCILIISLLRRQAGASYDS